MCVRATAFAQVSYRIGPSTIVSQVPRFTITQQKHFIDSSLFSPIFSFNFPTITNFGITHTTPK